jgi:hypothetical protein
MRTSLRIIYLNNPIAVLRLLLKTRGTLPCGSFVDLSRGRCTARHQKYRSEALYDIAVLIARLCFYGDRAAIRLRRRYLRYLAVHGENVTRGAPGGAI